MGKSRRPVGVRRRGHVGGLFGSPDSLAQVVTNDAFRIALLQLLQWTAVKLGLHAVYAVISQREGKRYPWLERFLQWVPTVVTTFLMTTASTNPKMIQMNPLVGAIAATFLRYFDNYLHTRQDQSAPDSVTWDTKDPMQHGGGVIAVCGSSTRIDSEAGAAHAP